MYTKLIQNDNGTFTAIDTRDFRPEIDHAAERKADQIDRKTLLKEFKWTDEDIDHAKAYFRFPDPTGFAYSGIVSVTRTAVYSRIKVAEWRERFLAFSAKVR
jgi:hypothetical protein